jgi:hypothetical protein
VVHGVRGGLHEGTAEAVDVADVEPRDGDVDLIPRLPEMGLEPGPDETLATRDERSHDGSR